MKRFISFFAIAAALITWVPAVHAQTLNLLPKCAETGDCRSLDDILQLFANVAMLLLSLTGSVVLLMFIWGSSEWIFSAGNADWVKRGKERMKGAIIGMVLVFSALAIIRTVQMGLQVKSNLGTGKTQTGATLDRVLSCTTATEVQDCGRGKKCTVDPATKLGKCEAVPTSGGIACTTDNDCIEHQSLGAAYQCNQKVCQTRCEIYGAAYGATCQSSCADDATEIQTARLCKTDEKCCRAGD